MSVDAAIAELERSWLHNPRLMERARVAGPMAIHTQHRMVTVEDYALRPDDHPLVMRAHAWSRWSGAWMTIHVAVVAQGNRFLDDDLADLNCDDETGADELCKEVDAFHRRNGIDAIDWENAPTLRTILRKYLDAYRMVGQEVLLQDAEPVGIDIALSVRIAGDYFQSEIRFGVTSALSTDPGGFFEPGRLAFGEDLHASDLFETLMALDGVEAVCLNRFKRVGKRYPDRSDSGHIPLDGLEIAVCDNDPARPERGHLRITLHGARKG